MNKYTPMDPDDPRIMIEPTIIKAMIDPNVREPCWILFDPEENKEFRPVFTFADVQKIIAWKNKDL